MAYHCTTERRSERKPLSVAVLLRRRDGSVAAGRSTDASDEGFGIAVDLPLVSAGEIVRLTIGTSANAPTFIAQVVWCEGSRIGLYCIASAD
jgi:hypothetical protein